MRIIVVGAGEVGSFMAETLSANDHDVIVIENDERIARMVDENQNVRVICDRGSSARALAAAEVQHCDFFLALTNNDETNLVAASLAKAMGAGNTFARVHDDTFRDTTKFNYQDHFGIDLLMNPERLAAVALAKYIRNPDRVAVEDFARGQVEVQLVPVDSGAKAAGQALKDLRLPPATRIALIQRGEETIVPTAECVIHPGDMVTLCGPPEVLFEIRGIFSAGKDGKRDRRVVIFGGDEIGISLIRLLSNPRFKLRVIESNPARCRFIADQFPHVSVIQGEGTSLRLLEEEQVGAADYFIACTRDDEDNVMTCLQARKLGVQHVYLAFNRADYNEIVQTSKETLGVEVAVSPRIVAAEEILRYISRERYVELGTLPGGGGRLIEFRVAPGSNCAGRKIRELGWPPGSIILVVQRRGRAVAPGPDETVQPGDRLLTILKPELFDTVLAQVS